MAVSRARVLHLITRLPFGGAERLLVDIVRRLDAGRFESLVCCIQAKGELAAELEAGGTRVLCLERMRSRRFDFAAVRDLARLMRAERISLVHSHLYHANLYGRLAAALARVPAIATVHNIYARSKLHRRLLNRWLARISTRVVAVSDEVRRDLLEVDGLQTEKVVTVHNGIDLQRVATPLSREAARVRLDVPFDALLVGCLGRLEEQKGHTFLLQAFAQLASQPGPAAPLHLVLAGDGRRRKDLEAQAAALGIASRTRFLGARRDVAEVLRALDIYAMPSLWEGLPLALLEAMAAGVPVVASDVGGVAEVLGGGEWGLLVPPGDAGALGAALGRLAGEPGLRARLASTARQRVAARYGVDTMVARLAALYEDALRGRA
jgi:glycosyltransferase involved in cell wall biosynthesis